jgi:putative hydrolase of the HAD superfamily
VIEVLVCDFGGVLTTPLEASFRYWSERSGVPLEDLGAALQRLAERDGAHPLHLLERGELTEADFLGAIGGELGGVDMSAFTETYFEHLDVNTELIERLRAWKSEHPRLRMAMCTNNVREWEPRWRAMVPVDELFEEVIDSAFVGARKPEPRIYEIVLERMGGVEPGACVLLDDFESNCEGARALGMHAVRFATTEQAIADVDAFLDGRGGDG